MRKAFRPESVPRISLIATFYNASSYLARCVESLLCQSHQDYEIVLVDDGSTDDTLELLEDYCDGGHVRCLTKENGGAGSARNYGVEHARGEFVSFVDGDDFVSPYYLEILDLALIERECDYAIGKHQVVRAEAADEVGWPDEYASRKIPKDEAVRMLAYNELTESPCGRLLPRRVYQNNRFPNRYYEDVAIASRHFLQMGDVAYADVPVYAYVMRKGSVVHRKRAELRQLEDFVWAIDELLDPIEEAYPIYVTAIAYRRALEYSRAHSLAIRIEDDGRSRAKAIDRELIQGISNAMELIRGDDRVPRSQVFRFRLLCANPLLYDIAFDIYERVAKMGLTI